MLEEEKKPEEIEAAIEPKAETKGDAKKEPKAETKKSFLNPFETGVSYKDFLKEVKDSKKSIAEYCKGKLKDEEISWIEIEIANFENNQTNK